jgi:hypothetical protein
MVSLWPHFAETLALPTLVRFLVVLALIGGVIFSGMLAFAYLVEPEPRDMSVTIPPARLQPRR